MASARTIVSNGIFLTMAPGSGPIAGDMIIEDGRIVRVGQDEPLGLGKTCQGVLGKVQFDLKVATDSHDDVGGRGTGFKLWIGGACKDSFGGIDSTKSTQRSTHTRLLMDDPDQTQPLRSRAESPRFRRKCPTD